jgi:transposase
MPRLDPATHNNTTDRLQTGQSQTEVARQFNVHQSTISRLWQRLNQTGSAQDRPRSRRPRITTPAQDRYIRVFHLRNRTVTATATAAGIPSLRRIYTQTVRNRLRQRKIRPRRPYVGSVLTQVHSCACVIHLGSGLWGTSAEFDSAMRVPFSSPKIWWPSPCIQSSKLLFLPCLRTGSWQIWRWRRHDMGAAISYNHRTNSVRVQGN